MYDFYNNEENDGEIYILTYLVHYLKDYHQDEQMKKAIEEEKKGIEILEKLREVGKLPNEND